MKKFAIEAALLNTVSSTGKSASRVGAAAGKDYTVRFLINCVLTVAG